MTMKEKLAGIMDMIIMSGFGNTTSNNATMEIVGALLVSGDATIERSGVTVDIESGNVGIFEYPSIRVTISHSPDKFINTIYAVKDSKSGLFTEIDPQKMYGLLTHMLIINNEEEDSEKVQAQATIHFD